MNRKPENQSEGKPLFRLAWRLAVVVALASYLTVTVTARNRMSCALSQSSDGRSTFLSCGSSAGNFLYTCNNGTCTESPGDFNQTVADQQCAQVQSSGSCPGIFYLDAPDPESGPIA